MIKFAQLILLISLFSCTTSKKNFSNKFVHKYCKINTNKCTTLEDVVSWAQNNLYWYNITYLKENQEGKFVKNNKGGMDGLPTLEGIIKHRGGDCKMLSAVIKKFLEDLNIESQYLLLKGVNRNKEGILIENGWIHMVVSSVGEKGLTIINNNRYINIKNKLSVNDILDLKKDGIYRVDKIFNKYDKFFEYYQKRLCKLNCISDRYYDFLKQGKFKITPKRINKKFVNLQ